MRATNQRRLGINKSTRRRLCRSKGEGKLIAKRRWRSGGAEHGSFGRHEHFVQRRSWE
jgi:hypothetical protein